MLKDFIISHNLFEPVIKGETLNCYSTRSLLVLPLASSPILFPKVYADALHN